MLKAERRARTTGKVSNPIQAMDEEEIFQHLILNWHHLQIQYNAGIPIYNNGVTLLGLFITGYQEDVWVLTEVFYKISSTIGQHYVAFYGFFEWFH